MYVYADTVGAMFICHVMLSVLSACGRSQSHMCMGKVLSAPARIDLKWFLNMLITFSAAFLLCMFGGTFWYSMPCSLIACRSSPDYWVCVSLLWCHNFGVIAWDVCMLCTFLLMFCFSWAPQGLGCHLFHTVPWSVILTGYDQELSCLVGVHNVSHIFHADTDYPCPLFWCVDDKLVFFLLCFFCWLYPLATLLHVTILCFVRLWEIFIVCCCCEHWPCCIESGLYCS